MTDKQQQDLELCREEALDWFVRLKSGHASAEDHANFARWLSASEHNRLEFSKLDEIWTDLDGLKRPHSEAANSNVHPSRRLTRRQLIIGGGALAASTTALAIVNDVPTLLLSDHYTNVGELASVTFPDGSSAELDAYTALSIDISDKARKVTLHKGRAFFDAVHDASRPFIVEASNSMIETAGTRFLVHEWQGNMTVSVEENSISVKAGHVDRMEVTAGKSLSLNKAGSSPVLVESSNDLLAWRNGKLVFEDMPLGQVISDLSRYRRGKILVTDNALLDMRVSGIFETDDTENALDAIARTLPVRMHKVTRFLTVFRPSYA
ncbi:MAG: FecR family protein [Pseudomonadota bacterium]